MSDKDKNNEINIKPFAMNDLVYEGSKQRLTGTNEIKLNAIWRESNSGSNNRISVTFNVSVRWDMRGEWPFRIVINGTQVASQRTYINFGSTSSEWSSSRNVTSGYLDIPKTSSSATVTLYIDNMDYWDATTGAYRNGTISQSFTLSLVNTEIIPGNPEIMILATENGAPCRVNYKSITESDGIAYRCYPAESAISSGIDNTLRFYTYRSTNATHSRIVIHKYSGGSWNAYYDSNWQTPTYHSYHKKFTASERVDNNVWWRVKAYVMSATNNTKETGWIYFFINDIPKFDNNNPNFSYDKIVPAIKNNIGITWSAAKNVRITTKYTIRYRASITSTWSYAECTTPSFSLNASNLSAYPRGCTIYFDVTPWDEFDQSGYVGSGSIKVNTLPTTSSSTISSDKDTSEFNYRYLNNVTFTLPSISDSDGQSTRYYVDYSINNGNSWVSYSTNMQPGKVVIDCSNFQNTRGNPFRLRAMPHDGLEFGSAIFSNILYKNQLPTLSSTIIQTDKDGLPYNNYYKDNVSFTFPTKSDADGHGCYYRIDYLLEGSNTWVTHSSLYNNSTITINCGALQNNRGKYIKFKVTPYDVFEEGTPAYSKNLIRNVLPKVPEVSTDYGKQYLSNTSDAPHNGHVEKIFQVTWKAINNECNGQRIDDSKIVVSFNNKTNNTFKYYPGQKISNTMGGIPLVDLANNYLNFVGRGSEFEFIVKVEDIFGETSQRKIGPFNRNQLPSIPSNFHVGYSKSIETSSANKKYRRIYFKKSTDPENDSIYYEVQIKRHGSDTWKMSFNNYQSSDSDIVVDLTDDNANCNDIFRIRSIDIHGAYSDWVASNEHALPSVKLYGPEKIYNKRPRVLFGLENYIYPNGYVNISIKINNVTYTNIDNPEYFSTISYKENARGIFRIPNDLTINGSQLGNSINIKTFLGDVEGKALLDNFNCYNSLQQQISNGTMISASITNNLQTMINDYYTSYKCTFEKQLMNTKNIGEISTTVNYNNMYSNLYKINEHINNFGGEFNPAKNLSFNMNNTNKVSGTNHLLNDINYILDVLLKQI